MSESTHHPQTVYIDKQSRRALATVQWMLEKDGDTHPITPHNHIKILICGQEGFASIAADLERAQSSVDLVCWGFDPGMELTRTGTEWPRGETYGDLLRRIATREKNPVKVRLLIWYSYLGGQIQKHMPGYTDGMLVNLMSDEVLAQWSAMVGSGIVPRGAADKPRSWERADHCVKWWRWARDKANAHMIEVRMRDGDGQAIRASLGMGEGLRPGHGGLVSEKTLLEDHGTHHQKTVLIDYHHDEGSKAVGYVMGLNSLTDYWDTREHLFNDPRREYDTRGKTETAARVRKARGKVDDVRLDPYQDYACRLQGEALACINANFAKAWRRAGGEARMDVPAGLKRAKFFGPPSSVQVIRTQPEESDKTIRRAYFHALEWARDYVYVENQYFQYEEWVNHLKKKREEYRRGLQERGAKGPHTAGVLHAFIVIPRPEIAQMAPRTFDTLNTLGRR